MRPGDVVLSAFIVLVICTEEGNPFKVCNWRHKHSKLYKTTEYASTIVNNGGAAHSEQPTWTTEGYRRPLHWSIKTGSLNASINFFALFGLKILRHEEYSARDEEDMSGDEEDTSGNP